MMKFINKIFFQQTRMEKSVLYCRLKGFNQQNYLDYIHQTIDSDQTLQDIFQDQTGQLGFKNYLKHEIFNNPNQLRSDLDAIYQQWDTKAKVQLKRVENFRLIMLMYLGLLERDFSKGGFYLIDMAYIKQTKSHLCQQKLKCFKHYIKTFYLNQDSIKDQQLVFSKNSITKEQFVKNFDQTNNQIIDFEFTQLKNEDHKNSTVVDFADENIGGLVLDTWNCAQEEVIMLIYPEAITCMLFIPKMKETEAVLIENLKKYSNYTGYEKTFVSFPNEDIRDSYNVLAIDAKPFYRDDQFTKDNIYRELLKCYAGFELSLKNQPNCDISTGRWGCGIFGGNIYLKALIQLLSFAVATNQVKQSKSKLIINCVNDQSLFEFGATLKQLLQSSGTQLNVINLKESILFLQSGIDDSMLQNQNTQLIKQIFTILTKDIPQVQKLSQQINSNDKVDALQQNIKQGEGQQQQINKNIESQYQDKEQYQKRKTIISGQTICIAFGILASLYIFIK
ncbi:unnamed protein product [Paramecium octaurelia]|uniref:PARG catalytic Macro domain-containing protein n=1 Tax=Paramecium octaurelia TaxID=43137 RepID=A0A8S1WYG2_PAROT|nr:unnamed protein product [Paramecium octaurelia]